MKATNVLIDEHKRILRALNVIEQIAANVEDGKTVDERDLEDILRFLKVFADGQHQGKEEDILFPAILRCTECSHYPKLRQMIFEHDQERSLVEGLEEALRTKKGKDFVYFAERLIQILRTHIYKEDHILFELADASLSPEEDERVAQELVAYERNCDEKVLGPIFERLHRLEWKYLAKGTAA